MARAQVCHPSNIQKGRFAGSRVPVPDQEAGVLDTGQGRRNEQVVSLRHSVVGQRHVLVPQPHQIWINFNFNTK